MILQVNGLALNVWVEGDATAPAVLLLHGWPDSCQLWKNQVSGTIHTRWEALHHLISALT